MLDLTPPSNRPPIYHGPRRVMPVHLTSSTVLKSGSSDQAGNARALVNTLDVPIEVLELKWQLLPASGNITGQAVGCQLFYANEPLGNGIIPVSSYCRTYNPDSDSGIDTSNGLVCVSWKLSKPLWIPPGAGIMPKWSHFGQTGVDVTGYFGYSARAILSRERDPRTIYLPFAAHYKPKAMDGYGAADSANSSENDLINFRTTPVIIDRFVGRIAFRNSNSYREADTGIADIGSRLLKLRMVSSGSEQIAPFPTTWWNFFAKSTRAWECRHEIDPGQYYQAFLTKDAPTTQTVAVTFFQPSISMVGYSAVRRLS